MADKIVAADDFAFIDRFWKDWSPVMTPATTYPRQRKLKNRPTISRQLSDTTGLMFGAIPQDKELADVQEAVGQPTPQPTLYVHGIDDACMGIELAENAEHFFPAAGSRVIRVKDAGHFVHLERLKVVNEAITAFPGGGEVRRDRKKSF